MTGLTSVQSSWWNPNDSTTKQCNGEGVSPGGGVVIRNSSDFAISTDATALSRLPAGGTVARFFAGTPGHGGIFYIGHTLSASDPTARAAMRWYRYYSPDFVFANEGGCHASKIAQIQYNGIIDAHGDSTPGLYGYQASPGWSPDLDCCGHGPGEEVSITPRSAGWAGSWLRFEVIVGNRSGSPGLYVQMYVKNITTNGPEQKLIDTTIPGPNFAQNWTSQAATQLTPPGRVDSVMVNAYRQDVCPGWDGFSHFMVAAWDTDAGQRIGPAVEVEGGGGPLASPTGLTVK
jgi:hypothetical protein